MFEVSDTAYDNFMGRYSRQLGPVFADFAGIGGGGAVLDVGAGTGALTSELLRRGATVAAIDPSPPFAAALERRFPGIDVRNGPAEALPFADESFDAALAQLVIAFMRDPSAGVDEMRRVVRPGGTVAVCMWDREGMEMLAAIHRTQVAIEPDSEHAEARTSFRTRGEIEALMGDGVEVELLEVESGYSGFDELWDSILGGAGPAGAWATKLDDERREAARAELHRQVGEPSGAFTLRGRAWGARVTRA